MAEIQERTFLTKGDEKFIVRTALPKEAEKVASFTKTILSESPYLLTTAAEFNITTNEQKQFLIEMVNAEGKIALVADYDGKIIGFLDFHNGHRQRIKHQGSFGMSVKEEFRNQGVGKALLTVLLEWGRNNLLIEKICLEVFANNNKAIALYKSFGFFEEGRKRKAIKVDDSTYYDVILMAYFVKNVYDK